MKEQEICRLLEKFLQMPREDEVIEFKEVKGGNFDLDRLGRYFSAISNEANLKCSTCGWLIFGVTDATPRQIVGTGYKAGCINEIKKAIADFTNHRLTFVEIYELFIDNKRVIMLQIPKAMQGIITTWKGKAYGREGESLAPLGLHEIEEIRSQINQPDWSAQICEDATINDLDEKALKEFRRKFIDKYKNKHNTHEWSIEKILDKAKITKSGKITNTAIILFGKSESKQFLSPRNAWISWKISSSEESGYEHFYPPFFTNVNELYRKIRNTKQKILPNNTLTSIEVNKYEEEVILEALNNCIAHQDYSLNSRIIVTEAPDKLIFENAGSFFEGNVEDYVIDEKTPHTYRNTFLANAMHEIGMIDTMGSGIRKMFEEQKKKYFPLPEYDLSNDKVKVTIYGKIIDENYTKMLIEKTDLDLKTVILLDKVQKGTKISKDAAKELRKQNLVEGRYPKLFVSEEIARITETVPDNVNHNPPFSKEDNKKIIITLIQRQGHASRLDIDKVVLHRLSDRLNDKQKINKIKNLLTEMAYKDKTIKNIGTKKISKWVIIE